MSDRSGRPGLRVAARAYQDIAAIDRYTVSTFGEAAADRYSALIRQALRDLQENPHRHGVTSRAEALGPAIRLYHLSFSRDHAGGQPVKEPRHFVVFRRKAEVIEVLRILHDSRDLQRHLPAGDAAG